MSRILDEIHSLEVLADLAAELGQRGRLHYCRRRIARLRAQLAVDGAR